MSALRGNLRPVHAREHLTSYLHSYFTNVFNSVLQLISVKKVVMTMITFLALKGWYIQRIQVERLMASVVAFVVTVELIALQGKMTDVARREFQSSAWENRNMLFPRQNIVIPA